MNIPDLTKMPIWYIIVASIFSLYYGWRGGHANYRLLTGIKDDKNVVDIQVRYLSKTKIFLIYSLHDFISHVLCSLSGFLALYILSECLIIKTTADSIFVVFLSLYSIIGITDLLPQLLPQGKFPGK